MAVLLAALLAGWLLWRYVFPAELTPVTLSQTETKVLETKVDRVLQAEPAAYSEDETSRSIRFTERELNALLAQQTDLERRLAIDLSDNLASATLLVPVPPDFPIMGGKTLRLNSGIEIVQREDSSIGMIFRGLSVGGVPLPDAWLGNLKGVDLAGSGGSGFWKQFAAGIEKISVKDGELQIRLRQ